MVNSVSLPEGYISRDEAAAMLRKNVQTLDRWRKKGYGPPATVIGRSVIYRKAAVDEWLAAQEENVS